MAAMIVSASRRTDIPAFYMPWFLRRLEVGWCRVVNPFNPRQERRVSLRPGDVDAIVFWTRRPDRLAAALEEIERRGHRRTMALVTVVDYGRDLHPHLPRRRELVAGMHRLAETYGAAARVVWRYDPILLGPRDEPDAHRRRFERLARELEGAARRVVVSFVDLYRKTRRRLSALGPGGYPLAGEGVEDTPGARALIRDLAAMAAERGIEMRTCAESLSYAAEGAPAGRCVDPRLLAALFPGAELPAGKDRGQRPHCGCCPSVDVGAPDTCLHGCVYCYAVRSQEAARNAHARHDPAGETLVPRAGPGS